MKNLHRHLLLATVLAAGLAVIPLATGPARAEESATVPTDPGFKPDTRQLNPGATEQAFSKSADVRKVPTPAESRAALRASDDPTSSLGSEPTQPRGGAAGGNKTPSGGTGDVTTATQGQAAVRRTPFARRLGVRSADRRGQSARRRDRRDDRRALQHRLETKSTGTDRRDRTNHAGQILSA